MELIQQWGLGWKHHLFQTMVTWQPPERFSLYQALAWAVVSVTLGSLLLTQGMWALFLGLEELRKSLLDTKKRASPGRCLAM